MLVNVPILFSGLYANINSMPLYTKWIAYASNFRYGLEALMYNEFEGLPGPFPPLSW